MNKIIISPSILSADFANLNTEINGVVQMGAQWIHIDVMDGHFVDNITIGAPVVKSIRKVTNAFLDSHLMIENPKKYIPDFLNAGSDIITFHIEASKNDTIECINMIKEKGKKVGIALKPKTAVEIIEPYLEMIDMALVMTVEPGFSGQSFMNECTGKIARIRELAPNIIIQTDGGINDKTAKICKDLGANCFVAGNYIFKSDNRELALKKLLTLD